MNVEPEMYDCTGNNWSHWNSNEKLKENFKLYRENIRQIHYKRQLYSEQHTQYGKYCSVKLKRERWGSLLVQEKQQEEKACDKRHPYRIIIITIITFHLTWTISAAEEEQLPVQKFSESPWLLSIMAAILSSSSVQRGY